MIKSHVILDHHKLIITSILIEIVFFATLIGGIVAYTLLNNELVKSEKSPSTIGDAYIIFPGACKYCDLKVECAELPKTALDLCNGHKMWIKLKGE